MGMIYERYEKQLRENNACDFDDLLLVPYLVLKSNEQILQRWQEKFRYILVDEAQDTNRIQFELMKLLTGGGSNITFIGDDYQSIYRRRGAVMENFLQVKKGIKVALPMQSDIVVTYYVRVKPERRQQFYANFLRSSLCAVGIRILKRVQYILDVSQKQATYQTAA